MPAAPVAMFRMVASAVLGRRDNVRGVHRVEGMYGWKVGVEVVLPGLANDDGYEEIDSELAAAVVGFGVGFFRGIHRGGRGVFIGHLRGAGGDSGS